MAVAELGRAVLELSTDDTKLYAGIDKGNKAALDLIASFDKAAKAISTDLTKSARVAEEFGAEIKAAFTSVDVGSRGVSAAIQKMIGADAVERANAYAKAVTAIGGVSKLTASEQQALFSTVTSGIQKYTALGIAAPKSLTDTAAAAKAALGATAALDTEAGQLATAIGKVGGASKLTHGDLVKVGQITTELVGKYEALGHEAPASLKSLQAESTNLLKASQPLPGHLQFLEQKTTLASKATDLLKGSVAQLASGFAIGNLITSAVSTLTRWTSEAINAAGATLDLSNKTGLSTDSIQKMDFAAKLTGATVDNFTDAAFKLGQKISGGSGSVRQAFDDLRKASGDTTLSWQALRSMNMDQQMDTVATALSKVENEQQRNTIAVALYGKGAGAIMPAIAEGWADIANQANIASREQLEAIDAMSDAWDAFVENRKRDITSTLGNLVIAGQEAGRIGLLNSMALLASHPLMGASMLAGMGAGEAAAKPKPASIDLPTQKVESYVAALKAAEAAVSQLSKSTIDEIMAAEKLGVSQDDIINRYDVTADMLSVLKSRFSEQKTATNEAQREAEKFAEAQDRIASSTQILTGQTRETVAWLLKRGNSESDIAAAMKVTAVQVKEVASVEKIRADALKLADKQAQEFVDTQRKVMDGSARAIVESLGAVQKWNEQLALQGTSGLNRQLIQIEQARAAQIRAIENIGDVESEITKQRRAAIDAFYDHERDLAFGTASTIVERMHEQGVLTRSELRQQADAAVRDYRQIRESGLYTYAQVQDAAERAADAIIKASGRSKTAYLSDLDRLGQAVGQFAQFAGDGIGGSLVKGLSTGLSALGHMSQATEDFRKLEALAAVNHQNVWQQSFSSTLSYALYWAATMYGIYSQLVSAVDKLTGDLGAGQFFDAVNARGGRSGVQSSGVTAGFNTDILLTTRSAETFKNELQWFDRAVSESNARLQRYGLTWQDLGDHIQQANIDELTRGLIRDWRELDYAGLSVERRTKAMAGGLSQLVIEAVNTGQKIPAALRPMLETLIRSGQLTDEAARKMLGMAGDSVPAFADVEAAAKRYGIEIGKLGPKIQQIKINETAAQIVKDWKLLQSAGADTNATLDGMANEVQELVTAALTAGVKIPEGMKPIIQALIDAGRLIDGNGNKLTDLGQLEFEKPLSAAIDDLIAKLDELIDSFSKVGTAAEDGFGRARGAAQQTGTAVPRGSTGTGETTPASASSPTPAPTPAPPTQTGGAQPRDGSRYVPPGSPILDANGNVVATTGTATPRPGRNYARGGLVTPPTYLSDGGFPGRQERAAAQKWLSHGTDTVPAMLTPGEIVLNAAQQKNVATALTSTNAGNDIIDPQVAVWMAALEKELQRVAGASGDVAGSLTAAPWKDWAASAVASLALIDAKVADLMVRVVLAAQSLQALPTQAAEFVTDPPLGTATGEVLAPRLGVSMTPARAPNSPPDANLRTGTVVTGGVFTGAPGQFVTRQPLVPEPVRGSVPGPVRGSVPGPSRGGVFWNPMGQVLTQQPDGSTRVLGDVLATTAGLVRHFAAGGLVTDTPRSRATSGMVDVLSRWSPNGTDAVPAMLTPNEYVLDTGTVIREGAVALKALQQGLATVVPNASLKALSAAALQQDGPTATSTGGRPGGPSLTLRDHDDVRVPTLPDRTPPWENLKSLLADVFGDGPGSGPRYYNKGGPVVPVYMASGGGVFDTWREWATASSRLAKGTDASPVVPSQSQYVPSTVTVIREGAAALNALQQGLAKGPSYDGPLQDFVPPDKTGRLTLPPGHDVSIPKLPDWRQVAKFPPAPTPTFSAEPFRLTGLSVPPALTTMTDRLASAGDWNRNPGSAGDRSTPPAPPRPVNVSLSVTVAGEVISSSERARQIGTEIAREINRGGVMRSVWSDQITAIVKPELTR